MEARRSSGTGAPARGARQRPRLTLLLLALAALVLVAGACTDDKESDTSDSGDSSQDSADATEGGDSDSDSDSGLAGNEGDNLPEGDFDEVVTAATAELKDAGDACEVFDVLNGMTVVGNPETEQETETASKFFVELTRKMSELSSDPELADRLATAADNYDEYAQSVGYDPEKMDLNGAGPNYEGAAGDEAAMDEWFESELENCLPSELDTSTP